MLRALQADVNAWPQRVKAAGVTNAVRGSPDRVCQYSCAGDARIWKDFAGMVVNQEWIDDHFGAERGPIEVFMETATSGG
jgi:hypothetical protein